MTDIILKFPKSKRKLTVQEERLVRSCSNIIFNSVDVTNPFITDEQKIMFIEEKLKELIRKIDEVDEEKR